MVYFLVEQQENVFTYEFPFRCIEFLHFSHTDETAQTCGRHWQDLEGDYDL